MIRNAVFIVTLCLAVTTTAGAAPAKCLKKAAMASGGTEKTAKWFTLETMVRAVDWGIWPAFIISGTTPGYRITKQRYSCKNAGGVVTCKGRATFCMVTLK